MTLGEQFAWKKATEDAADKYRYLVKELFIHIDYLHHESLTPAYQKACKDIEKKLSELVEESSTGDKADGE